MVGLSVSWPTFCSLFCNICAQTRGGTAKQTALATACPAIYFFSLYSPSRRDFRSSTLSPFRPSSLAVSPFIFHVKLKSVPTGSSPGRAVWVVAVATK
jgi:hypothetical protein